MRPVTDPAILSQLEGAEGNLSPVTDPALIAQLEGEGPTLKQRLGNVPFAMQGAGETALQMMTGLAGAFAGAGAGIHNAFREGSVQAYAPAFHAVQEALTYAPRTEAGKGMSGAIGDIFHKYSEGVDYVADRTPGGPLAQTAVKTIGEGVPLFAPFVPGMMRGRRAPEARPVTDPALVAELERQSAPEAPAPSPVAPDAALTAKQPMAGELRPVNDPVILAELERLEKQSTEIRPNELFLERPTEAGLAEEFRAWDAKAIAEQDAIRAQEQKALADSQLKDFELTGSERQADINPRQAELRPVDDAALVQQLESANVTEINVRQRKVKPPTIDFQNDSISSAVSKLGGLDPSVMQDVAATGKGAFRDVKGFNYVSRKGGKYADEMAELLHERGYLSERSTNELFAKLDDELRAGEPKHFSTRQNVDAYMESLLERKYGPSGQFYSGIPLDKAADTFRFAGQKLGDALGVPTKGVEVQTKPPHPKAMNILDQFRSPSELVTKYPDLKPYVERAQKAQVEMDTLRDVFSRRLKYVDQQLGGGMLQKAGDLGKQYRTNKKTLNELLLEGDFEGKRFTKAELTERGIPLNIQNAYIGIRSAYDHALSIANNTRALRGKDAVNKREGYIPHFFHDYFVKVDGEIVGSGRSLREAVSMANEAARSGAGEVTVTPKGMKFPGEETQAAVVGDATYFKLREAMEDAFSMTTEQANALLDDIARMRGRSRVVGNFLERKGASGWEKNLDFAHKHYFNMISRYAALDKFKSSAISNFEMRYGSFDKEYKGLPKYVKDYINDLNGVPTRVEELLDSAITNTPGLKQLAQKYLGDRPSLEMASATTNAVAVAKLGLFNVSAALVNASQALMANALLGPRWWAEGARRAAMVEAELGKRRVGVGGETTSDLGILRQLDIPVQHGLEGSGLAPTSQMGGAFRASMWAFNNVEFANRATAGLGAYYKALAEGRSKPEALQYAREVNRRSNFDYSLADSPNILRRAGPAGQVLGQFKKFSFKSAEFMTNLKGAEHARFWVPFVVVSGLYGLPGMEFIKNAVKGLFDVDIELESKDTLIRWAGNDPEKKRLVQTIMYGAFSNPELGGIDVSRRVGQGDIIPSEMSDLAGPAVGSVVRATQMAAKENWAEVLRAIATSPGNLAVALQADVGITSPWDRDRLTARLDTKSRVMKGLGFASTEESKQRDTARVMRYGERNQREDEKEVIDQYIKAYLSQDQAGIQEATARISELNMQNAGKRIAAEMQKKGMPVSERAFDNLSKAGKMRQLPIMDHAR